MKSLIEMVEEFQCPGCVGGNDTRCGQYKYDTERRMCISHVLGTSILGLGNIAIGLPKGFCRPGFTADLSRSENQMPIRLWGEGEHPKWDRLNVPVWAMEKDDTLFVRTYSPRINRTHVDVIDRGTLDMCPDAINVGEFIDEID